MEKFWELFEQSIIMQGLITFALVVTACYLFATGQAIPVLLSATLTLVLGYYFGAKNQHMVSKLASKLKKQ